MSLRIKFTVLLSVLIFGVLVLPRQASAETSCEIGYKSCIDGVSMCDEVYADIINICLTQSYNELAKCDKLKAECDAVPEAPSPVSPSAPAFKGGSFKSIDDKLKNVAPGFYGDVTPKSFEEMIGGYIKTGLALVGVIFLLLMVYGGYTWMIARGDETEATKAKDTITMAAIGMAVVLIAYVITYFILSYALGSAGLGA